jgi:hypothetical protein
MSSAEQNPIARMAVPASLNGCGMVFALLFVGGFVGGTVALAVYNLWTQNGHPLYTAIPSVLWLGIVAFGLFVTLYTILYEIGVRETLVAGLGEFSLHHFVEVERDGERVVIAFGFTLFGMRFDYLRVEREQILSVRMSSGQASALAGRDMNDWHVSLWYRDPAVPPRFFQGRRIDEIFLIGRAQARVVTEEWFGAFVVFLRTAGVVLVPGPRENEFSVPDLGPPDHAPT